MASIINASTSGAGGLISTADSSGVLNIQTAGTTAVTIDASQNVTFSGTITGNGSGLTGIVAVVPGTIIQYAGTTAPSGYLVCPTSLTNISRTTYAALFAAIGTTWGSGDGSTTFGLPWFAADYAAIQANSNVGTATTGQMPSHTHSIGTSGGSAGSGVNAGIGVNCPTPLSTTSAGSGTANLSAGTRVLHCIKY